MGKTKISDAERKANLIDFNEFVEEIKDPAKFKAWVDKLLHCPACNRKVGFSEAVVGRCLGCGEDLDNEGHV